MDIGERSVVTEFGSDNDNAMEEMLNIMAAQIVRNIRKNEKPKKEVNA